MISIQSIIQPFLKHLQPAGQLISLTRNGSWLFLLENLEIPIESLQTKVELLQHENGGLKETYKMKEAMQKPSLRLSF